MAEPRAAGCAGGTPERCRGPDAPVSRCRRGKAASSSARSPGTQTPRRATRRHEQENQRRRETRGTRVERRKARTPTVNASRRWAEARGDWHARRSASERRRAPRARLPERAPSGETVLYSDPMNLPSVCLLSQTLTSRQKPFVGRQFVISSLPRSTFQNKIPH